MANGGQVNYSIKFNVDKTSLTALDKELTQIQLQAAEMAKSPKGLTEEFKKASEAAKELQSALDASYNEKLNQINLSKFNSTLKNSGLTAQDLMQKLANGPANAQIAFNNLTRSLVTTNVQLKTTSKILDSFAVTFKNTVRYGISSSIFNNLSNSIAKAYDYSVKLDKSLNDIRIVSDKSAADMERFAVSANKAARELGRSTLDYAKASTIFFQQGLDDIDVEARTQATLKAANVTGQSGEAVSEQLTAVWNGYKVSAAETELYVDKLAAVAASTAADLEELSTGMSKVASAANIMGVDIDQLNAQLATVVSVTRQAPESVGTAFKTIYARMGDIKAGLDDEVTLGSYTSKMAELGFNVLDANGELRDMGEVIEEIGNKWNTMSREEQIALSHVMAGQRQYNNLLSLFDNWDMYTEALNTSKNAAGELQREQDIYMETTKAHLQQLSTEAERTYAILFDKKAVNGFYDTTRVLLDEFNDWIEGLGGGINAIINLVSQLGIVFRKQIGESIVRNIDNIKQWRLENQINLGQIQKYANVYKEIENRVQASRKQSVIQAQNMPAELQGNTRNEQNQTENLYLQEVNKNTDELIAKEKELLSVKNYVSAETFNEIQNNLKDVAAIKDKISYYKIIKENIQNLKGEDFGQDEATQMIEDGKEGIRELTEQYGELRNQIQNVNITLKQYDEFYADNSVNESLEQQKQNLQEILQQYDSLWLQAVDNGVLSQEEYEQKKQLFELDKLINLENKDDQMAEAERERLLNALRKQRNELQQRYNGLITQGQELEVAFDEQTQAQLEQELQNKTQQINSPMNQASQTKMASQYTTALLGITQIATSLIGTFQVLGKEGVTGAEKANAIWSGASGTMAGIANMIMPGSGFVVQGISEAVKGGLELLGVWDKIEDSLASTEEKLQKINEQLDEMHAKEKETLNKYAQNKEGIAYLEDIEDRFNYLQELAQKGLLTKDQQNEYEGYLLKIKNYNDEIIVSYDAQGNLITSNTKAIEGTIAKLKESNDLLLRQSFTSDRWDADTEVLHEQHRVVSNDYYSKKRAAKEQFTRETRDTFSDIVDDWDTESWKTDFQTLEDGLEYFTPDKYSDISKEQWDLVYNLTHDQITEDQINKIIESPAYLQEAFKAMNKYMSGESDLWDAFYEHVDVAVAKAEAYPDKIKSLYQDTIGSLGIDTSLILNDLKYNSDNSSVYDALFELGVDNIDTILTSYLQGINVGMVEFQTQGVIDYDKIRKKMLDFEIGLRSILLDASSAAAYQAITNIDSSKMTSQQYEDAMIKALEEFLATITNEDQFNKIKDLIPSMFGLNMADVSFDKAQGHAVLGTNGGNIVTQGERKARTIGRNIAEQNVNIMKPTIGNPKQSMAEGVEQYLQKNLDEVSLANLDESKFVDDFDHFLAQAIAHHEQDSEFKFTVADITQQALDAQGLNKQEVSVNKAVTKKTDDIKNFNLDEDELKTYAKHLMDVADESKELNDSLEDNADAAVTVAKSIMRMNRGIEKLADNFEDWQSIIKKSDKSSQEYADAIDGMKDALADVFDVTKDAIPREFIEDLATSKDGIKLLTQAADGNAKAIDTLRDKYSQKIFLDIIDTNGFKNKSEELLQEFKDLQAKIPKLELGEVDDEAFIKGCQDIVAHAGMTAEQATQMFNSMGFDVEFETEQKPIKKTGHGTRTVTELKGEQSVKMPDGSYMTIPAGWETKTYPGEAYDYVDYIDVVAMSTDGKTPKIKSITKKGTGSSNNYSSSNKGGSKSPGGSKGGKGGGSSSKPKTIEKTKDESDRYHKVNTQIEKTANNLSKIEKAGEKALGGDWVNNLTQQFQLLNNQIANYNEKLRIANGEQDELKKKLAAQGVTFNSDGTIANYNAAFDAQLAKLNALEDQYNHLSAAQQEKWDENKTIDNAKEEFNKFKENMDRYDELVSSFIPDLQKQIQDAIDQIVEKQIEKFNKGIELRLDMAEAERDWNKFKTKVIDGIDEDDIIGQTQARLNDFATYYNNNATGSIQALIGHLNDIMGEMDKKVSNVYGKDDVKELEDLRKYYEELMEEMEGVFDLQKEIHENYLDMMDEVQDKFDKQIEAYETITDLIDHDMNVIQLIYGEKAYKELSQYYQKQKENYLLQLDLLRREKELWQEEYETAASPEEKEKAKEHLIQVINEINDLTENALETFQDDFLNSVEDIFATLNDQVTKNKGLDYIETEWQLINKEADQYLDTINQLFETQALENKYLDAIDNTDNLKAQKQLKELMDEEIAALREKDKLTQYDIDRANKRYEIALKQIALEEAQQNKSTMRLRRDSQGNYRYEYVADNDAIDQARDELERLKNDLYNFDKEQYQESLSEMYDIWVEWQEALKEAAQINDPEEQARKEALINETYGNMINNMLAENVVIRGNLQESAFEDLALLYNKDLENYTNMTNAEKDALMNDLVPTWSSGVQNMIDDMIADGGFYPVVSEALTQLKDAEDELAEGYTKVGEAGGQAFGDIRAGIDETIDFTQSLIEDNETLTNKYKENLATMRNLTTQIDELAGSFKDAGDEATNVIQRVHDLLKQIDEKNAKEYEAAAKAATKDTTATDAINGTTTSTTPAATTTTTTPAATTSTSFKGIPNIGSHNALVDVIWGIWQGQYGNGTARKNALNNQFGGQYSVLQGLVNNTVGYTSSKTKLGNRLSALGYDTGGYTGVWGNNGRLAFLHQKELVLNAQDTENMLNAISVMRNLTNSVGIATLARLASLGASGSAGIGGNGLEQNVHISASFPNATSSREIEEALLNLTNRASQLVGRR